MSIEAYSFASAKASPSRTAYEPAPLEPMDVEVEISHCGICHSDLHLIDGDFGNRVFPLIPGHEIVGTVRAVGEAAEHLQLGQRVGVGWQAKSCMACEWCVAGFENLCPSMQATCVKRPGGFAEAVRVDSRFAFALPESLSSEDAAPLLCAGITVFAPLKRYATPNSRVGVVGIGGLGHIALQFARAFGCEVTAFSTSQDKEPEAKALGADHFVVSTDAEQMRAARNRCDLILSTAHVNLDWKAFLRSLRPNGKLVLVGIVTEPSSIPSGLLVNGQKSIQGSAIGSRSDMTEMLEFAARHGIKARTEAMPMKELESALDRVRNNQARYRVVLTT